MQTDRRQIEIEQVQVLDDKRIDTNLIEPVNHLYGICVLLVVEQGIDRHENLYAVGMGVLHHFRQVLQRVAGRLSRTVSRCTDIDGIRAGLNRGNRYAFVARRSEEAKRYMTMPAVTLTFIECLVPY